MTLLDLTRKYTQEIYDALSFIEKKINKLRTERLATEDRLKRTTTEISSHRQAEIEKRKYLNEVDEKVAENQKKIEDLEKARAELITTLMEQQEEKQKALDLLKETKKAIENTQNQIQKARSSVDEAARELHKAEEEKQRCERRLNEALLNALGEHLLNLSRKIEQAFIQQEDQRQRLIALEELKKARHEDRRIGDLCDQKDQFCHLLSLATVPAVKQSIQSLLIKVEDELRQLYPSGLADEDEIKNSNFIEELHYFSNSKGNISILLPIDEICWNKVKDGDVSHNTTRIMQFIWSFLTDCKLKHTDGQFYFEDGRCCFTSTFTIETMELLKGFNIQVGTPKALQFIFSPLLTDIQETLLGETKNA